MKLTKISASGFKGRDAFSYDLEPMTVFFGANFRGKSRVMDAIRLALLGYLPELGNTNPATFGLASGTTMTVQATFDNGTCVTREWALAGNSVKKSENIPDEFKALGDLSVMLNAESYFGLGDRARVDYVFAHCAPAGVTEKQDILDRLMRLTEVEDNWTTINRIHEAANHDLEEKERPIAPYVEAMIAHTSEEWKDQKAAAVRAEKMIQQLTAMRLGDDPSPSIAILEEKRRKVIAEIEALHQRKGEQMGQLKDMTAARMRRAEITRELGSGDQAYAELKALTESLAALEALPDQAVSHEQIQVATDKVTALAMEDATVRRTRDEAHLSRMKAEKSLDEIAGKTECPFCGAKGDGWKVLRHDELMSLIDAAKAVVSDQETKLAGIGIKMSGAQNEKMELLRRQKEMGERESHRTALKAKIATFDAKLGRLEMLAAERDRLMADDPAVTTAAAVVQTEIRVKDDERASLDREIKVLAGRQFELKRLADAEKERDKAKASADFAAVLGKELRVIQGEMVAEAFKPLLERANSYFGSVLVAPIAYNDGEIGMWRDGQWVGHRTFSGTEKALTYAAIQMALAMQSPLRLMLIDELGRLDEVSLKAVMMAVLGAITCHTLDGFVGIDVAWRVEDRFFPRAPLPKIGGLHLVEIQ